MAKKSATVAGASGLTLAMIVAATQSEQGFMYASSEAANPFTSATPPLAEMNTGVVNPNNPNEFAVRATAEGINSMTTNANSGTAAAPAATGKPTFELETIDAPEATKRAGGGGVTVYPFDDMAEPVKVEGGKDKLSAFFVPATEAKPKPWESLQSAVSAATRRYATKTGEKPFTNAKGEQKTRATYDYTRKFKISEGEKNGVKGAWVSRVQ